MARFSDLKLCCDFSHWVCVCERLLDGETAILRQCAARCIHLHARVGYEEGPQVPDPRAGGISAASGGARAMVADGVVVQRRRGDRVSTLTPEFGPPPYLHTLPFTDVPVSDLRKICDWQARRQASNFARCVKTPRRKSPA